MTTELKTLLRQQHVDFAERGPNVAQGNINIRCPFCAGADPSHHLGIRMSDLVWACWRNQEHRGRRPHRLFAALFGWSFAQTDAWLGTPQVELSGFLASVQARLANSAPAKESYKCEMPAEFVPLTGAWRHEGFRRYVESRGFGASEVIPLAERYGLRVALAGGWAYRVTFPVEIDAGVTWTGRTISHTAWPRYKAAPRQDGFLDIKSVVWNQRQLLSSRPEVLVVVEGPFDSLKVDWYGRQFGVRATCIFGSSPSASQYEVLRRVRPRKLIVAFDADNYASTIKASGALGDLDVSAKFLSQKDFAVLSAGEITRWCKTVSA